MQAGGREWRDESDSMGQVPVPAWAYWGAQTQRARENFTVSGLTLPPPLIAALGLIKQHAAEVNRELGLLDTRRAEAIAAAAGEVAAGRLDEHFPVDVFQTGSGTSSNMNANEVIAGRANELLGAGRGGRRPVHPNDHVNLGQSSNDVFPSAIHLATRLRLADLLAALEQATEAFAEKSREFGDVLKLGRTHLQDALPITLGQELSGYAAQLRAARRRIAGHLPEIEELALGGTAVGTGLGAHPRFAAEVIGRLRRATGLPFQPAPNRFAALAARDALVGLMGALNALAVALMKIGNDLRLLASGPRAGLAEIALPALQPGSSIMPGKVNPVIPEMVIQVAAQVTGAHLTVTVGGQNGPLELNIMMPLIAQQVLFSIAILERALHLLDERCVRDLTANRERCAALIEQSLAMVTPLAQRVGYDRAAQIAGRAFREGRTVREVLLDEGILGAAEADELLDPRRLAEPPEGG